MLLTRLKYWREHQGLSLRKLAAKSKIPYSAISLLENGKREPQGRTVHKLAQALGVEVNELSAEAPVVLEQKHTPAPVINHHENDKKTITESRTAIARPTRAKKKPAPISSFWIFENQENSDPFKLDTLSQARRLQEKLGGLHQARVYEATSRRDANEQHTEFLREVARGRSAW
jgi:transcriptional regulator with XRE-family HTH domain